MSEGSTTHQVWSRSAESRITSCSPSLMQPKLTSGALRVTLYPWLTLNFDFPGGLVVKNPPASEGEAGDSGLIPSSGRSPEGGNGNPPSPVSLPGKSHRQKNLVGYSPRGCRNHAWLSMHEYWTCNQCVALLAPSSKFWNYTAVLGFCFVLSPRVVNFILLNSVPCPIYQGKLGTLLFYPT